jgi:very-short-patch-repair endonuclease
MHAEAQRGPADRAIGRIAEGQHGVIGRSQLSELGLGTGAIKHREEAQRGLGRTRSELEERFQALLLDAAVSTPATNVLIEGLEVDCAWPDHRLIVELDSRAWHDTREAFETDRGPDRRLGAAGWRVVRITWRQLHETPREVERDLQRLARG